MTSSEENTTKKIQQDCEKVFNFDGCEKSVRGGVIVIQSVVNNAIKQKMIDLEVLRGIYYF